MTEKPSKQRPSSAVCPNCGGPTIFEGRACVQCQSTGAAGPPEFPRTFLFRSIPVLSEASHVILFGGVETVTRYDLSDVRQHTATITRIVFHPWRLTVAAVGAAIGLLATLVIVAFSDSSTRMTNFVGGAVLLPGVLSLIAAVLADVELAAMRRSAIRDREGAGPSNWRLLIFTAFSVNFHVVKEQDYEQFLSALRR